MGTTRHVHCWQKSKLISLKITLQVSTADELAGFNAVISAIETGKEFFIGAWRVVGTSSLSFLCHWIGNAISILHESAVNIDLFLYKKKRNSRFAIKIYFAINTLWLLGEKIHRTFFLLLLFSRKKRSSKKIFLKLYLTFNDYYYYCCSESEITPVFIILSTAFYIYIANTYTSILKMNSCMGHINCNVGF